MPKERRRPRDPKIELQRLRARLEEAEQTLTAIRNGDVDAIAVDGPHGRQVFTLQNADQPYRILAEQMSEGAASIAADGTVLFCNERLASTVGRPAAKIIGTAVFELVASAGRESFRKAFAPDAPPESRIEVQFERDGGGMIPVLASVKRFPNGPNQGFCLVATDLRQFRRAESEKAEAQEEAQRLAAIVNSSNDGIIGKTPDGVVTSWNPGAERIFGYSAEEMIGRSLESIIPARRIAEFRQVMLRMRRGEGLLHYESERKRKDGCIIAVSLSVNPIRNEKGEIIAASTIVRDVSEQKRAEAALRCSEARYRSLVRASAQILWMTNAEGLVVEDLPLWRDFTGMSNEQVEGSGWISALHPEDRTHAAEAWSKATRKRAAYETEYRVRRHDGQYRHMAVRGVPVIESGGTIREWIGTCTDITDRRIAENKLEAERQRFEAVLDKLPVMICLLTPDYNVRFANRTFQRQFGSSEGRKCYDFCFGRNAPCEFCESYQVLRTNAPHDWEITTPDDRRIHAFDFPFTDSDGSPLILEMDVDVTEQKQAEEKLREASRYVRSLIEANLDPLVTISREGKITDANQATENATGVTREKLIGSDFSNYFAEPEKARAGYEQVFSQGFVQDYPLSLRHVSGEAMDVLYNAAIYRDSKGEVAGIFAAARDVTARKRAEEKVREASRYVRSLIEASPDPLVTISREGKITDANQATENATGIPRERLIGSDFLNYFTEPEKARAGYERVFSEGFVHDYPLSIRHVSGSVMDVLYNAALYRGSSSEVEDVFAAARDVTQLKKAERELLLSRERLALSLKAGHAGTFDWDIQNNVNIWTPEVEEVHGLAPGEFGGKYEDWEALVLPQDLPTARQNIESALKSGEFAGEWRIRRRGDGEIRWIIARAKILFDDAGKPWRMIGVNVDVTERKQAEEEVRKLNTELEQRVIQRTAQLEAANKELEAFTYSVSHDLRAPLRHISGFSKILCEEFGTAMPADAQRHLKRIDEGTVRMGQLVDDLLNLARVGRRDLSPQVTSFKSLVDEVIESLKSDVGDRQVEWRVGELPYLDCDAGLIKQVFQNLLSNALKFTRPRQKTVIEIGQQQREGLLVVFVRDNGVGFSMKYADKLFGVFQRLHRVEDFEGTGVGLATVQRIILKHGGRIWAEAELDKGATFYFSIGKPEKVEVKANVTGAGG